MGDSSADTSTETAPDAVIHVEAEPAENDGGDVVVVVDNSGEETSHDEVQDAVDEAVETERRFAEIERRLDEVESRSWMTPTVEDVVQIADAAVTEAVVESAAVAEVVAEDVAEETAEEIVEDVSPHKTHWFERSVGEWFGRNGSGKG